MTSRLLLVLSIAVVSGCSSPTTGATDAGTDAFVPPVDAAEVDAGVDAALPDLGMRDAAPPMDAGPLLPDRDAGDPFGDAGPAGPPAWVPIDVLTDAMCDPLVACGGDEVGTWDVSDGCIEVPVPEELMMCPGATFTAVGMARGRVTFDGVTAVRTAQSEVRASIHIPGFCATIAGGCDAIATMVMGGFPDSACGEDSEGDCNCEVRQDFVIDDADAYTIEGNQIVSAVLGKRWDYCVGTDGTMRYQDVSPSGGTEPGIITLSPVL